MKASSSDSINIQALRKKAQNMDKPQWLISDDKIDHGPFSGPEVIEKIESGNFLTGFKVKNILKNDKPISLQSHPLWGPLVGKTLRVQNQQNEQKNRLQTKRKKTQKRVLFFSMTTLALAGAFFAFQNLPEDFFEQVFTEHIAVLKKTSESDSSLQKNNSERIDQAKNKMQDRKATSSKKRPQKQVQTKSFEKGLEEAVQFKNMKKGSKEQILSSTQVTRTLDRKLRKFRRCFLKLPHQGKGLGQIPIDIAIAGSGKVLGVSTRKGNDDFKHCIDATISKVRFPSFSSPRMTAHYSLYSQ